jgi:hypothetical protein
VLGSVRRTRRHCRQRRRPHSTIHQQSSSHVLPTLGLCTWHRILPKGVPLNLQ